MSSNRPNKARLFSEVVSLRAWRSPFDGETGVADIYADVVFGEGRIGAEKDSPVRFKLALQKAEIHLVVPEHEPLSLDPRSLAVSGMTSSTKKTVIEKDAEASIDGSLSTTAPAKLGASGSAKVKATQRIESEEVVFAMEMTDRPTGDGHCWIFAPGATQSTQSILAGRAWDQLESKAKVKLDEGASLKLPPTARFEVRCRREDLVFSNIVFKDESISMWEKLTRKKQEAVASYLRDEMARVGLVFEDFEDPYGVLVLADDLVDE